MPADAYTFKPPIPDPLVAELLKRDSLIETWTVAYHNSIVSRDRLTSDLRSELYHVSSRANELADALITAQRDLSTARAINTQNAEKLTIERAKLRIAEQTAKEQRDKRLVAEARAIEHRATCAQLESRCAKLQLEHHAAGHALTNNHSTHTFGTPGQALPILTAPIFRTTPRDSGASFLSDAARANLLQVASRPESPHDAPGEGTDSPRSSTASSTRRRSTPNSRSPNGVNSPPPLRRRRRSPTDDFASESAGSSTGRSPR